MILTPNNKQLILLSHEHDPIQPRHAEQMGLGELDYLQHLMPQMAKAGYLRRITCDREELAQRYACYRTGLKGRHLLTDEFGVHPDDMRYKRVPKKNNVRWFKEHFFTTDISIAIRAALGGYFHYRKVVPFGADNIHEGQQVHITVKMDYSLTLLGTPTHLEADNAGGKDEDGYARKSESLFRKEKLTYKHLLPPQQSVYRKLLGYLGGLKYSRMKHFVLIVTQSYTRACHMHDDLFPLLYEKGGNEFRDFVLVSYWEWLKKDPLNNWCNLAGENASLLPERPYHGVH